MQALEGIRVLDLSRLLPGPYCTMLLADFGAEVIKIEEPGRGDYARSFPPFLKDFGYWHLQLNRNKKSVVLNLKSDAGRRAFLELVKTADVVVESYRPGVLEKLGIDYAAAKAVNPRIIYCSLTGYGKKGPRIHVICSREISGAYFPEFLRSGNIFLGYFHVFHAVLSSYHAGKHLRPVQTGKYLVPRFSVFKPINAIFLHRSKKSVFTGTISSSIPNSSIC